jgi:hypothetical protein
MLPRRRLELLTALAFLVLATRCGQGDGDRCEIDDDCSGGLVCDISPGRQDGVCREPGGTRPVDAAAPDRMNPDTAVADRAPDQAPPSPDAGPDGLALPDALLVPDASAPDGAADAGSATDRSAD